MPEQIILVNKNDRVIGYEEKVSAHHGEGKLHRASSVFLFNTKGELLIQQRSKHKIVGTLQWANTCCGNVNKGETRKQCALRRLREELGITNVSLRKIGRIEYHIRCNNKFSEWEIDDVFVGLFDGNVYPNPDEVKAVDWINSKLLLSEVLQPNSRFAPWVRELIIRTDIKRYL